jgi:predicted nucleotidyltransferase
VVDTIRSASSDMTLEQVTARLSENEVVTGLLLIGSATRGGLTPASDVDLVIVLAEMPVPLHVGVTNIDGTLTDLIFLRAAQTEQVLGLEERVPDDSWLGRIVRWLEEGTILFDRTGQLAQAQEKARSQDWLVCPQDAGYSAWFAINYNLAQTRRLLVSEDPIYLATADLRMALYATRDLVFGYFRLRGLRWEGDKAAIRYLMIQDPGYLALLTRFLDASDRRKKQELYERLAALTTAPIGELWQEGDTAMTFDGEPITPGMVEAGLGFWQDLLGQG